eukprot:844504-Prymnesium_polylepis.1
MSWLSTRSPVAADTPCAAHVARAWRALGYVAPPLSLRDCAARREVHGGGCVACGGVVHGAARCIGRARRCMGRRGGGGGGALQSRRSAGSRRPSCRSTHTTPCLRGNVAERPGVHARRAPRLQPRVQERIARGYRSARRRGVGARAARGRRAH